MNATRDKKPDDAHTPSPHAGRWKAYLGDCGALVGFVEPMQISGRVTRVAGLVMELSLIHI